MAADPAHITNIVIIFLFIKSYIITAYKKLEYAKLKLCNYTVKLYEGDPIISLFDIGATSQKSHTK